MTPQTYGRKPIKWTRSKACGVCGLEVETETLYAIKDQAYCPQCFHGSKPARGKSFKIFKRNHLGQYVKMR